MCYQKQHQLGPRKRKEKKLDGKFSLINLHTYTQARVGYKQHTHLSYPTLTEGGTQRKARFGGVGGGFQSWRLLQ